MGITIYRELERDSVGLKGCIDITHDIESPRQEKIWMRLNNITEEEMHQRRFDKLPEMHGFWYNHSVIITDSHPYIFIIPLICIGLFPSHRENVFSWRKIIFRRGSSLLQRRCYRPYVLSHEHPTAIVMRHENRKMYFSCRSKVGGTGHVRRAECGTSHVPPIW